MSLFKNFSEDFENRILSSKLDELSKEDLQQLEAEGISQKELQDIKATLIALEGLESEEEIPSGSIRESLLAAFDEEPEKRGGIISMPIWITVGISIAALFVIAFMLYGPNQDNVFTKNPVAEKMEVATPESTVIFEQNKSILPEESQGNSAISETKESLKEEESSVMEMDMSSESIKEVPASDMPQATVVQVDSKYAHSTIESEKVTTTLNSVSKSVAQSERNETVSGAPSKKEMPVGTQNHNSLALSQMPNVFDKLITVY
jgi:hypothetical protein